MVEGLNMIYLLYCYYIKDKYIRFFDIKICMCVLNLEKPVSGNI